MPNFVRVKDEQGDEFSISELAVQPTWTVLDKPATANGRVLKGIPHTPAKTAAPASTPENKPSTKEQ